MSKSTENHAERALNMQMDFRSHLTKNTLSGSRLAFKGFFGPKTKINNVMCL